MTGRRIISVALAGTLAVVALVVTLILLLSDSGAGALAGNVSREEFPVWGIDVSAHNGEIDFERVKADSIEFVLIKATEGSGFKDRRFRQNYYGAKAAGLKVGAYHFFRFDATGYMQGLNLYNSIKGLELDLPVIIDIEEWTNPREWGTEAVVSRLNELLSYLERHGYKAMLYTNKDGYERFIKGRFDSNPLWIATFSRPDDDMDWQLWQHTHSGTVDGIRDRVDMNVFNGELRQWRRWLDRY